MPQPTPYVRSYDFTNYQEQYSNQPLPAAPLDANLDLLGTSINQVINRAAIIQRDDGQLKNQIVGIDALSNTVRALLGTALNPRGDWVTATVYAKLDMVNFNGVTYICAINHTSNVFVTDRDAGKWLLFSNPAFDTEVSTFFQKFSGDGVEDTFTLSDDLGTDENALMVFYDDGGAGGYQIQPPQAFTVNGNQFIMDAPPVLGTDNVFIFSPSRLLGAIASAQSAAEAAQAAAEAAQAGAETAQDGSEDARDDSEAARDSILNDAGFIAVSADLLGADTIGAVAAIAAAVSAAAAVDDQIVIVAGIAANVTTVAGIAANVTAVANNASNINTVVANLAPIISVAAVVTDVQTVAANITDIQNAEGYAQDAEDARDDAIAAQAAAEAALASTLAAFDSFDDRYLGTKTVDPTLDNDGNPLVAGAIYFNSIDAAMKVYTGSIWVAAYVSGTDFLAKANNLSDLSSFSAARTNLGLGIGVDVQAYDATLDSFASLAVVQGDLFYGSGSNTVARLAKDANATRYLSNQGSSNNPSWSQINLTNGVTGLLPFANIANGSALSVFGVTANAAGVQASIAAGADGNILRRSGTTLAFGAIALGSSNAVSGILVGANGGTNNGFMDFTGPASTLKTFTLPNASATILTSNALVTAAQGGTNNGFFQVSGPATTTKTYTLPNATCAILTDNAAVTAAQGGTGQAGGYAVGDLLQASAATTLSKLAAVATGNVLISGGVTTVSSWGKVGLTTHVSGTLPVTSGGTGVATLTTAYGILAAGTTATGNVQTIAPGTAGYILTSNGASALPTFQVAPSSVPVNTPVQFTSVSSIVLTIDTSLYSEYAIQLWCETGSSLASIDLSQNAGSSYYNLVGSNLTANSPYNMSAGPGNEPWVYIRLIHNDITGTSNQFMIIEASGNRGGYVAYRTESDYNSGGAINRIRLSFGGNATGQYVIRQVNKK